MRPGSKKGLYSRKYLIGKTIVFLVTDRTCYGFRHMIGKIHEGKVELVYRKKKGVRERIQVKFWHGPVSNTMPVWLDHIFAIYDEVRGTDLQIGNYSGKMIDLRSKKQKLRSI